MLNLIAGEVNKVILIPGYTNSHKLGTKITRPAQSTWTGELVLEISRHNTLLSRQQVCVLSSVCVCVYVPCMTLSCQRYESINLPHFVCKPLSHFLLTLNP